ncbi:hypothetical protein G6F68_016648 [Rhizopus microsporus]|nr:hypothetical protein G6F68_016648 [Rhizopus microsporus]
MSARWFACCFVRDWRAVRRSTGRGLHDPVVSQRPNKVGRCGLVQRLGAHLVLPALAQAQQLSFVVDLALAILGVAHFGHPERPVSRVSVPHPHRDDHPTIVANQVEGSGKTGAVGRPSW